MKASRVVTLAAIAVAAATATLVATERPASAIPPGCLPMTCTWVPGYLPGALRGDVVLKAPPGGAASNLVTAVMMAIGLIHTHSGMMMDGANVRHNTAYDDAYSLNMDGVTTWEVAGYVATLHENIGDVHIDSATIKRAAPGILTGNLADMSYLSWPSGWVSVVHASDRSRATHAADQFDHLNLAFGLYAFSQPDDAIARDGASMCAGSILKAWQNAEANQGGFMERLYLSSTRAGYAASVYSVAKPFLASAAADAFYGNSNVTFDEINFGHVLSWSFAQYLGSVAAETITRQLINAMAFGHTNDYSNTWAANMNSTYSFSSDDLLAQVYSPAQGTSPYVAAAQPVNPVAGHYSCVPNLCAQ